MTDPSNITFRLAHVPGATLMGAQIAAVKDAARKAWPARTDRAASASVLLPGIAAGQLSQAALALHMETGAVVTVKAAGRAEPSSILTLTPTGS